MQGHLLSCFDFSVAATHKTKAQLLIATARTSVLGVMPFGEDSYWDRVRRNFHLIDPRTLLVSDDQINECRDLLNRHAQGEHVAHEDLFRARKVVQALVHPDTQETVFRPLSAAAIVPVNVSLDTVMIMARTPAQIVFAQWLNQTYNALHYRANRNASNSASNALLLASYVGATSSAVAAALVLNRLSKRLPQNTGMLVCRLIPFGAVAAADLLNLAVMRHDEYMNGVQVFDKEGQVLGVSRVAGAYAVGACVTGRILAAAPILILPNLTMHYLEQRTRLFSSVPKRFRGVARTAVTLGLVATMLQISVPLSFGIFRQRAQLPLAVLEPGLRGNAEPGVSFAHFNKGI
ncbi:MAG: hypothetical protein MHM6MM_003310 [Cercozoa sp. M6MM]